MIRALETGEIATGRSKADFILDSRIRERSFGKWDGKYREDLDARCRELGAKDIFETGSRNVQQLSPIPTPHPGHQRWEFFSEGLRIF